ncbi:MAG: hypothetical protein M1833_006538 [Piccolia ochrophora]|nr:MAG: hypothetical protein M1833_006538 [Piccolia ochrophora]
MIRSELGSQDALDAITASSGVALKDHYQRRKGKSNVFDAVAGRLYAHPLRPHFGHLLAQDHRISSSIPLRPEEALFRRKAAPPRYEEDDFYFADETLTPGRSLPHSDLLKAIHTYASDFYSHAFPSAVNGDWSSMDETALLALGMLLEEVARESMGDTGDLVFAEGAEEPMPHSAIAKTRHDLGMIDTNDPQLSRRPRKRRKVVA